jgi:hypothetical protein
MVNKSVNNTIPVEMSQMEPLLSSKARNAWVIDPIYPFKGGSLTA